MVMLMSIVARIRMTMTKVGKVDDECHSRDDDNGDGSGCDHDCDDGGGDHDRRIMRMGYNELAQ